MKVSSKLPNSSTAVGTTSANPETSKAGKVGAAESILDTKKSKGAGSVGAADSAKVELSTRAQDMKRAKELATPSNDIDEAKVARLQALIDSGKYKVDAEAIADRLLDEHSKMP